MRIVSYATEYDDGQLVIYESTYEVCRTKDIGEAFAFLCEDYDEPGHYGKCIKVCWNLDDTVAPILKLIGKDRCIKLWQEKRYREPPFDLFYVPGKVFSVRHIPTKLHCLLYGIDQYYTDLSEEPETLDEVVFLGERLMKALGGMGMVPSKLTSPVAIYDECVMSHLDLPRANDMPAQAAEYAWYCAGLNWIEAYQLGYWDKAFDYDIKAAFPTVAMGLYDFRHCDWFNGEYRADALYGYAKCEVKIYDWVQVSPVIRIDDEGELSTDVGEWQRHMNKAEIDFIRRNGIGKVKILDGWWAVPKHSGRIPRPLEIPLKRLLEYKERNGLQSAIAKRMAAGVYGKQLEERGDSFGPYFNPAWAAEITTATRLEVARWLYSHGIGPGSSRHLIHIGLDGALLDKEVEGVTLTGMQWRLDSVGEVMVASAGLVFMGNKRPRGLSLEMLKEAFVRHPRKGYYEWKINRRVTLGDALARGKFDDLGKEKPMISSIDFYRQSHKRIFKKLPRSGGQLLGNHYRSEAYGVQASRCEEAVTSPLSSLQG